jgi:hypothetical protein
MTGTIVSVGSGGTIRNPTASKPAAAADLNERHGIGIEDGEMRQGQ